MNIIGTQFILNTCLICIHFNSTRVQHFGQSIAYKNSWRWLSVRHMAVLALLEDIANRAVRRKGVFDDAWLINRYSSVRALCPNGLSSTEIHQTQPGHTCLGTGFVPPWFPGNNNVPLRELEIDCWVSQSWSFARCQQETEVIL